MKTTVCRKRIKRSNQQVSYDIMESIAGIPYGKIKMPKALFVRRMLQDLAVAKMMRGDDEDGQSID